jgi:hypothetical protein
MRVQASFPSFARRGGRDTNQNVAKPPLTERTGWWPDSDRNWLWLITTPAARLSLLGEEGKARHLSISATFAQGWNRREAA